MRRWTTSLREPKAEVKKAFSVRRDRLAISFALVAAIALGAGLMLSKGSQFLMPGPLASAHGAIGNCSACHTKSGDGKLTWLHGLVAGDHRADSKACLTCHKMTDTAFNAHGASKDVLAQSTERLTKIAASTPVPLAARAENAALPAHEIAEGGLPCATCHQEHKGTNFNLAKISNEQCRSCHVVKFDSFDGNHPKFEAYPFVRRTRLIYDHAGHFGKHYPELAKKDPSKRIPETCSTCHNSNANKLVMAVAPFEQTCAGCHLDQIVGKERATGPKGIAFLSLPGLDLQTLRRKRAVIGEWPDASDAELTPFMKIMIGRSNEGRDLLKIVDRLDLKDLANADDQQIRAVTNLVLEVKRLFHALIAGKASDVLGNLNIASGATLSPSLVADLTANIPRDVIASAQKDWLPGLGGEIANGVNVNNAQPAAGSDSLGDPKPDTAVQDVAGSPAPDAKSTASKPIEDAPKPAKRDPPPCLVQLFGQCMVYKDAAPQGESAAGTNANPDDEKGASSTDALPIPMRAGLKGLGGNSGESQADGAKPATKAGGQSDDLLNPTEEELRAMKDHENQSGKAAPSGVGASADGNNTKQMPPSRAEQTAAPIISIESNVDPETWAEYGGWYRQDYTIFYRPAGHKDKFLYSWLFLTGPQAPKGAKNSAAAGVFDALTGKDAQGSCTKCHSVDDLQGKGRVVNFSPVSAQNKLGSFTRFVHEPHFGILETRGCLTCHELAKDSTYLKSFEQGNPQSFASNFNPAKKDLCQTCHTSGKARQDCLLCHNYHVNGAVTPIMSTRIPDSGARPERPVSGP